MNDSISIRPLRYFVITIAWLLIALSLAVSAQPPLPDPIFDDGFDPANRAPVADPGIDLSTTVGVPLLLDGSGSSDPDGDTLSFGWSVIERPAGSGAELFDGEQVGPTLIPDRAGVYVVELVVSDGELLSVPATITVTASGDLPNSALIGPAGGAVGLPDGASVLIPPGALDSAVTIAIAEITLPSGAILPPTGVLAGSVYDLTPNGQNFERPVQIVVPYDPGLLPPGYSEGAISIYRHESWPEFNMVGSDLGDDDAHSSGQTHDPDNRLNAVLSSTFSSYAAVGVRRSAQFTPVTLSTANASVIVRRPPNLRTTRPVNQNCMAPGGVANNTQTNLTSRLAGQIAGIIIHSTNSGNVRRNFEDELGWGADDCNQNLAHYYINRSGDIYQVADDLRITFHVGNGNFGLSNTTTIGIELFHNVGEPYDGRQIAAMIRLVDYLMSAHTLPRPQRDPATGIVSRNRAPVSLGGDRVIAHTEAISAKCDPSGTFMDSGIIKPEYRLIQCRHQTDPRVQPMSLSVGNSRAPALMDLLLDSTAVLARDSQHTGIINTHGGDSFDVAVAGAAGAITIREDAALVGTAIGVAERTQWEENEPTLLGPGPLIVAAGGTMNLTGPMHEYTDVIVAGTLNVTGDLELHVTGSVYVSPLGKVILRNGPDGADLTVYSRGTPVVQGLIDTRGEDGVSGNPVGGHGGNVSFVYAAPGILLVPTLYARGGDVDTANVTLPGGGPIGGHGGAITIQAGDSHIFLGGGVGPVVGTNRVPTWHSAAIDPTLLTERWGGDHLPPSPPTFLSSFGTTLPPPGVRPPLQWSANQVGFARGIITAGGMGGVGLLVSSATQHGGPGGQGGNIQITLNATSLLTFRDIDIVTGSEIETLTHRFSLPPPAPAGQRLVCPASGAHGGFGQNFGSRGGDGGAGGDAGALSVSGAVLAPPPTNFVDRYTIRAFPSGQALTTADELCSRGSIDIGQVIEARSASGVPLYRLRLNTSRTALLGGLGGIPSGRTSAGYPGDVGPAGATAPITGVPVQ